VIAFEQRISINSRRREPQPGPMFSAMSGIAFASSSRRSWTSVSSVPPDGSAKGNGQIRVECARLDAVGLSLKSSGEAHGGAPSRSICHGSLEVIVNRRLPRRMQW
jgi:hypothetical protein